MLVNKLNAGTNNIAHDLFSIAERERTSEPLFQITFQDYQALLKDEEFSIYPSTSKASKKISQETGLCFRDVNEIAHLRIKDLLKRIKQKIDSLKIQKFNIVFICPALKFEELKKLSESILCNRNEVVKLAPFKKTKKSLQQFSLWKNT